MGFSSAISNATHDLSPVALETISDRNLACLIRESSPTRKPVVFEEIVRRYEPRVKAWCFRISRDRDRACDLAQDVFLRAYVKIESFRGDSQLSTWLYTISRNHCFNELKRNAAVTLELGEALCGRLQDGYARQLYDEVEQRQVFNFLWSMITPALNPLEVRVLEMHYGFDISLQEITKRLALSNPSGAKAFVVNARRKITALRRREPALKQ
jgi:RNA polymerase sigma-70 factor, ECF subfamily